MKRINKLLDLLKENEIDGFLVASVHGVTYLSGFTGDSSFMIITGARIVLLTDERYTEQAQLECHKEIEVLNWIDNKRYGIETYRHVVNENGIKRLGFEEDIISYSTYKMLNKGLPGVELIATTGLVERIRVIKDDEEICFLKEACEISDRALELTVPFIKSGITEIDLTARLEYNIRTGGADGLSFESIVLSGAKTSLLHGKPGRKALQDGDFVLFDFGALYKGYHADISRTFVIGKAGNKQKEIYDIIQKSEMEAIMSIKPGISARIPDEKVRENIPDKYISYYYPRMGHGVGLQIHEAPFIDKTSEYTFVKNMTLTVEPGIYIPGWGGIRIEDTVLVNENACEIFTNFPREMINV
ncbi:MAG: aminopeptidase P family protein [Bacteroidales bacterium]|nr:MAG: aminopeptidase P family protein [Bacteroidales bacterium]